MFAIQNEHLLVAAGKLAMVYSSQGKWTEAEELTIKMLETQKSILGENHPDTSSTLINLAEIYNSSGRYEQAAELYLQTLELMRAAHQYSNHPDILTATFNLGTTYSNQTRGTWLTRLKNKSQRTGKGSFPKHIHLL